MLQQGSWSPRLSLEGFLKKTLHDSPLPLSSEELVHMVQQEWLEPGDKAHDSIAERVRAVLTAVNSAFAERDGTFSLAPHPGDELHQLAYLYVKESGTPQKYRDILQHLQLVTRRSRGDLMSRVDLDRDCRFARLESGEWLLTEWKWIDDGIADDHGQLSMGLERATASALAQTNETNWGTEEFVVKYVSKMVEQVIGTLQASIETLRLRDEQIPNEAIEMFNAENLEGIATLMKERKTNAEFTEDLQELVNKWTSRQESRNPQQASA
jgi:hypothetical protein